MAQRAEGPSGWSALFLILPFRGCYHCASFTNCSWRPWNDRFLGQWLPSFFEATFIEVWFIKIEVTLVSVQVCEFWHCMQWSTHHHKHIWNVLMNSKPLWPFTITASSSGSWQALICFFVSIGLSFLGIKCAFLSLVPFIQHNAFGIQPCCYMSHHSFLCDAE